MSTILSSAFFFSLLGGQGCFGGVWPLGRAGCRARPAAPRLAVPVAWAGCVARVLAGFTAGFFRRVFVRRGATAAGEVRALRAADGVGHRGAPGAIRPPGRRRGAPDPANAHRPHAPSTRLVGVACCLSPPAPAETRCVVPSGSTVGVLVAVVRLRRSISSAVGGPVGTPRPARLRSGAGYALGALVRHRCTGGGVRRRRPVHPPTAPGARWLALPVASVSPRAPTAARPPMQSLVLARRSRPARPPLRGLGYAFGCAARSPSWPREAPRAPRRPAGRSASLSSGPLSFVRSSCLRALGVFAAFASRALMRRGPAGRPVGVRIAVTSGPRDV
ncbi:UNVERIFIED_CONTAM: hypothetical protein Sangu_3019600 [Sesamum angustifolium]|uniref:Uncharacterized protein n=1 Tax=Sesamum angustifolium TaxID=2727405 RepID=A0AAW2KKR1_9LAMI